MCGRRIGYVDGMTTKEKAIQAVQAFWGLRISDCGMQRLGGELKQVCGAGAVVKGSVIEKTGATTASVGFSLFLAAAGIGGRVFGRARPCS